MAQQQALCCLLEEEYGNTKTAKLYDFDRVSFIKVFRHEDDSESQVKCVKRLNKKVDDALRNYGYNFHDGVNVTYVLGNCSIQIVIDSTTIAQWKSNSVAHDGEE